MPWTEPRPVQRLNVIRACHAGTDSLWPHDIRQQRRYYTSM